MAAATTITEKVKGPGKRVIRQCGEDGFTSVGKAYRQYPRLRRRRHKDPEKINRRYKRRIMRELGITPGQPFKYKMWVEQMPSRNFRTVGRMA